MPIIELNHDAGRIEFHDCKRCSDDLMWSETSLVKQIPGKAFDTKRKVWYLPLSWSSCVVARGVFGDKLRVGAELGKWARERRTWMDACLELRTAGDVPPPNDGNDHHQLLYPYQRAGRAFLVNARNALLGDEMGTGKTFQTLAALRVTDAYPALVICPNSLKRNWANEAARWLPEANAHVIDGSAPQRRKQLAAAADDPRAIVIVNVEATRLHSRLAAYGSVRLKRCIECDPKTGDPALKAARCEVHPKELNAFDFKVCILDEAHRVKDPRALQTRAVWQLFHAPAVRYRWALTGTPVANHPGDLWSILHTIDKEEFPAKTAFLDRYALMEMNAFGGVTVTGLNPKTKDEFFTLLDPRFRRMLKADVLTQLPPKVFETRRAPMSREQTKLYREMADHFMVTIDETTSDRLVADGNLAAATRLLQLASASVKVDKGETPDDPTAWSVSMTAPSSKVDEMMSIIEDNPGRPIVIAAEHRQLIDLAAARLEAEGIRFGRITGGQSAEVRAETVAAFQAGKLDYVLFTYKAGGVGITLTRADMMIRLQRSWSLVDNKQGEDRCHRVGSEIHESITIVDLIAEDTIEEDQLHALFAKAERAEEVMRDRKPSEAFDIDMELTKYEEHADNMIDGGP